MFEDRDLNLDNNNLSDNDSEENTAEVKNQCASFVLRLRSISFNSFNCLFYIIIQILHMTFFS